MWEFSPGSRLRDDGKKPSGSPSVWACLSTLDTALHLQTYTCLYTHSRSKLPHIPGDKKKKKTPPSLSSHRIKKTMSADSRRKDEFVSGKKKDSKK